MHIPKFLSYVMTFPHQLSQEHDRATGRKVKDDHGDDVPCVLQETAL